uniref:Transcriptional regulator ATRX n=1 Tax=Lygus hesperus TaxID=30085 RepID=A0A0A9YX93_LYGHE
MAMDIDPFSMLEVSLQEGPEIDSPRVQNASSGVMHQVENDVQIIQPPPPLHFYGSDVLTPQRAVLQNIQKLSATSKEEEKFRRRAYSSISLVLRKRLHCTICDAHIGAYLGLKDMDIEHPLLKVLACSKCTLKYHYLDFPLNVDGRDIRCRWCTNSSKEESPLRYCNYCPFAFCEMCIYRNLPLDELASNKNNWICFVCNVKDLWPSRAVLWALRVLIDTNLALKEEKKWSTDQSTCCKNKVSKQRRIVPMSQGVGQPTNGHNVAVRAAVLPNHQVRLTTHNNYLVPINRAPIPIVRPVLAPQATYRPVIAPVQPVRPITVPAVVGNSAITQLYDTSWLTEKVSNISTTLLNLNNNLHRLAQGIPEKENKYSIKSKMISMVSLLNISATQLQKASKEMEEESKRILDKNYRVARINPVPSETKPPVASTSRCPPSLGKRPPPRSRTSSSSKRSRRYRGTHTDSDTDPDDPDFRTKAKVDGFSDDDYVPGPEDDTSRSSTRSYETRACFVKLERLNYKYVAGYDSGSDDAKSDTGNRSEELQPSTSSAPDSVVPSSSLPDSDRREADSGIVDVEDRGEGLKEEKTEVAEQKSDGVAVPKETEDIAASKESDDPVALKETEDAEASTGSKNTAGCTESESPAACTESENPAACTEPENQATCEEPKNAAACGESDDAAVRAESENAAACGRIHKCCSCV